MRYAAGKAYGGVFMVKERARLFVAGVNDGNFQVPTGQMFDQDIRVGEQVVKSGIYAFQHPVRAVIGTYDRDLQNQLESVRLTLTMGEISVSARLKRAQLFGFPTGDFVELTKGGVYILSAEIPEE